MDQVDWEAFFAVQGAYWRHRGNPRQPHAILTSGKHSDGYLNCSRLIELPVILERVCLILKQQFAQLVPYKPDWVVGSPYGSITLAYELARQLNCRAGFTELDEDGKRLRLKRFELKPRDLVMIVDDVITTGGTTSRAIAAVEQAQGQVLNPLCAIANRSGSDQLDGREIVALIKRTFNVWDGSACPLCAQGSEALRPKGNWHLLTQP